MGMRFRELSVGHAAKIVSSVYQQGQGAVMLEGAKWAILNQSEDMLALNVQTDVPHAAPYQYFHVNPVWQATSLIIVFLA